MIFLNKEEKLKTVTRKSDFNQWEQQVSEMRRKI